MKLRAALLQDACDPLRRSAVCSAKASGSDGFPSSLVLNKWLLSSKVINAHQQHICWTLLLPGKEKAHDGDDDDVSMSQISFIAKVLWQHQHQKVVVVQKTKNKKKSTTKKKKCLNFFLISILLNPALTRITWLWHRENKKIKTNWK